VQIDGSLVINPVQKTADSGVYTCWARNKQGHSARRSGEVTVIGKNIYNEQKYFQIGQINKELEEEISKFGN